MSPREAKRILELLAQGVDPETGEVLPSDNPLNAPAIIRALFLGARALDGMRSEARARPSNDDHAGKPWIREEEQRLIAAFDANTPIAELAKVHGRSKGGIAARLVRLGKIKERAEVYAREPHSRGANASQGRGGLE
ncbi:MAG: hypothetical protein P9F75_13990 [Candidatus Contendobacter sp.]|nr:hypothetical protein [Candidatus Contendobacter sp.]